MRKALIALSAGVVAVALSAACGNVTTPVQAGSPTPTPSGTGTATPTATPTGSATATPVPGAGVLKVTATCGGATTCPTTGAIYAKVAATCGGTTLASGSALGATITGMTATTGVAYVQNPPSGLMCISAFLDKNGDGMKNTGDYKPALDVQNFIAATGTSQQTVIFSAVQP